MTYFPEEVVEQVFNSLTSNRDRNAVSLVCKSWYGVERFSRYRAFISNCYAVTPDHLIARFPRVRSLLLKGKPNCNSVPRDWGGHVFPWIQAMANGGINLEELRLKRMVVSDESLVLLANSFPNFKSLALINCQGFTTDGIAAIASSCRALQELDLQENKVHDLNGQWLSCFPDGCTSLVTLNFACLKGVVNTGALERLVSRCRNLRSLRVNESVPLVTLQRILVRAPQLTDLGTGLFTHYLPDPLTFSNLKITMMRLKSMRSFSGFHANARCLPAIYPICANLTYLNLRYAPGIYSNELTKLICLCEKLERLWVLDAIGDKGLSAVAMTCKELQELRVFPSWGNHGVTEEGLVVVSGQCPKLNSVLYFCQQMTNAALITVARNCPNFIRFQLCTINPTVADAVTKQPLDEGFGAIIQACKDLKRLSITGLLTDQAFLYIGMYGEQLEMLSIAFAGNSDKGMNYVLNGCKKLKKLEIRSSPFGDSALLADVGKYETMRSLWMSSCEVTLGGCKTLATKMPRLNVEIINDGEGESQNQMTEDGQTVKKLYLYRTLAGRREDAPGYVQML